MPHLQQQKGEPATRSAQCRYPTVSTALVIHHHASRLTKKSERRNHLVKVKRDRFFNMHQGGGGVLIEQAKSTSDRLLLCRNLC
jgi:hypothetical protein